MARTARVVGVVAFQLAILVAVPARTMRARLSGALVTLRTAPIDPFDVLSGHYVTLAYEVEREGSERGGHLCLRDGDEVWLTVERRDPAWALVDVTPVSPAPASGRVAIRARCHTRWGPATLGIDGAQRFYVTEERGAALDARRGREPFLVDLRVGADGTPALLRVRGPGVDLPAE